MAISSIQPIMAFNISGFSAVMQATATSPPQLLSVSTQTVTTPGSSTIVTIGTAQPLSQPLFNASGQLIGTGTTTGASGTSGTTARLIEANLALAGSASPDLTALDATGFGAASVLGSPTGTTGVALNRSLAADVQTAVAGLDLSGPRTIGTVDLLNPNTAPSALNGAATTLAATGATPGAATLPNEAASGAAAANAAAVNGAATVPTFTTTTAATAAAPATPATPGTTPAAATTGTEGAAAATTPGTPGAATPGVATGTAVVSGSDAAAVLQRLVTDATTRAISNIRDPAFAATSAALFVSAAIFRSLNDTGMVTGVGTADTAGAPPPEVTPPRPVLPV